MAHDSDWLRRTKARCALGFIVAPDASVFHTAAVDQRQVKPPLVLVSGMHPPQTGGLADHTLELARRLAKHFALRVLTGPDARAQRPYALEARMPHWRSAAAIVQAVRACSDTGPVLWQYVPHMYGRGGVNLALPRAMAALRRLGRRQVVIAHEIQAGWSPWPHRCAYSLAHRWQWHQVVRAADAIGFSTEAWLMRWSAARRATAQRRFLLPSPSNFPVRPVPSRHREDWRRRHGLEPSVDIHATFGASLVAARLDWVLAAWRGTIAGPKPAALVVLGPAPHLASAGVPAALYRAPGFSPPGEVSEALQAADLLLLPFVDGVSERRSTFMAGLSHGCPVVTTVGPSTGPTLRGLRAFAACDRNDRAGWSGLVARLLADSSGRAALAKTGREIYVQEYDWAVIAGRLASVLDALCTEP
jgi:glycosyltransferase involved in cell wall biosynthesis